MLLLPLLLLLRRASCSLCCRLASTQTRCCWLLRPGYVRRPGSCGCSGAGLGGIAVWSCPLPRDIHVLRHITASDKKHVRLHRLSYRLHVICSALRLPVTLGHVDSPEVEARCRAQRRPKRQTAHRPKHGALGLGLGMNIMPQRLML